MVLSSNLNGHIFAKHLHGKPSLEVHLDRIVRLRKQKGKKEAMVHQSKSNKIYNLSG